MAEADEAEDDDEPVFDGDEFVFDGDEFVGDDYSDDEGIVRLIADPDFTSCGTGWLDKDDSCHHSIQIEHLRTKCRRDEAYVKLKTWDEHEGDTADGCNSGVATKREGYPSQIRATQEADHPRLL